MILSLGFASWAILSIHAYTWGIVPASLRQTRDLPQDTWLRECVENNAKELFIPRWHDDVAYTMYYDVVRRSMTIDARFTASLA
jgi:hypothetical protein